MSFKVFIQKNKVQIVTDKGAKYGPPDKSEHFTTPLNSNDDFELPPPKKVKEDVEKRRDIEVMYSDGVWYKGWLSSFNFNTGIRSGLSNFMTMMKLLKYPFRTRKSDYVNS